MDKTNDYPIALGPKPNPAKDTSSLIPDNLRQRSTQVLELNARLTRNQEHQQGISSSCLLLLSLYPLFSFLSTALNFEPIEPQNCDEATSLDNPARAR